MSQGNTNKKGNAIDNAEEIIERFGGIRPMAKKMGVAVTTVQGWKKRDTIPAGRRDAVIETAINHDVDLSDLMPDAMTDAMPSFVTKPIEGHDDLDGIVDAVADAQNTDSERNTDSESSLSTQSNHEHDTSSVSSDNDLLNEKSDSISTETLLNKIPEAEEREIAKDVQPDAHRIYTPKRDELDQKLKTQTKNSGVIGWVFGILILLTLAVGVFILSTPNGAEQERYIETQSGEPTSFLNMLIPQDLDKRIKSLQEKTGFSQDTLDRTLNTARAIGGELMGKNGGTFEKRAERINAQVQDLTGLDITSNLELKQFSKTLENLSQTDIGQAQLSQAIASLSSALSSAQAQVNNATDSINFEDQLKQAQSQMPAVNQTLASVPTDDLQAAAVLLAFTQFRKSLNRDGQAFDNDLVVLKTLVGKANPELIVTIDRLAPYAAQGILTPDGLSREFKTLAGDAVVASIQGENVDFGQRVKGRIGEVMQVEKNGELLIGNDTQIEVNRAQNLLAQGDLARAVNVVESMDGPAADILKPWLRQAKGTLQAQKLDTLLSETLSGRGLDNIGLGGGHFIRDQNGANHMYVPAARF